MYTKALITILAVLLKFSVAQVENNSGEVYVWPTGYLEENYNGILFYWQACPFERNCSSVKIESDSNFTSLRHYSIKSSGRIVNLIRVDLQFSSNEVIMNKLNQGLKITAKVGDIQVAFVKNVASSLNTDLFIEKAIWSPSCFDLNSIMIHKVPCESYKFVQDNLCESEWVCSVGDTKGNSNMRKKPIKHTGTDRRSFNSSTSEGLACFQILTYQSEEKCAHAAEKLKVDNYIASHYCQMSASKNKDGSTSISVSAEVGKRICLSYKILGKSSQICKISEKVSVTFELPYNANKLQLDCGDLHTSYVEDKKLKCPFVSAALSDKICTSTKNPSLMWASIAWLFIGLPVIFLLNLAYLYLDRKMTFRQFKNVGTCNYCGQWYGNTLTMRLHNRCELNRCPYCQMNLSSKQILVSHSLHCASRLETINNIEELVKEKWNSVSCRLNGVSIYTAKLSKILWAVIFFSLFVSSFADDRRTIYRDSRSKYLDTASVNVNSLPAPRDDTGTDGHEVNPQETPIYEHKNNNGKPSNGVGSNGMTLINGKLNLIANTLTATNALIEELSDKLTRTDPILDNLNIFSMNFMNDIQYALKQSLLEYDMKTECGSQMSSIDLIPIYPVLEAPREERTIRVHKDDAWMLYELHTKWKSVEVITEEDKHKSGSAGFHKEIHAAESAAVAHAGRADTQIVIGGGHSRPQLALGGSTQNRFDFQKPESDDDYSSADVEKELQKFNERLLGHSRRHERKSRRRTKRDVDVERLSSIKERQDLHKLNVDKKTMDLKMKNVENHEIMHHKEKTVSINHNEVAKSRVTYFSSKHTILTSTKNMDFKNTHKRWHNFEDGGCQTNCLHIPNSCDCIEENIPEDGIVKTPWATINVFDEKPFKSKLSFSQEIAIKDREEENVIYTRSYLSGMIDLLEGNSIGWEISYPESEEKHTLSVSVLKLATVFRTKFLYWTCERNIETEVKDYCTGDCDDYCGGRVCLGTEVWKWANCRNWRCNPTWCLAIGDGCCCCGNNIYCDNSNYILGVWEVEPVTTEFLFCIYHNDRAFHCQKIEETTEYMIGDMKIGITKTVDSQIKFPSIIATKHKIVKNSNGGTTGTISEPEKIFLDPDVCTSPSGCNHGSVGDLQAKSIGCLLKVGKICADTISKLKRMDCNGEIYFSESGSQMTMNCQKFNYHKCTHHGVVKSLTFSRLENHKELLDDFIEKKVKVDIHKKELLFIVTSRRSSGLVNFQISVDNMEFKKKNFMPKVHDFSIFDCSGCYSCETGFSCKASLNSDSKETYLITISSDSERLTMAKHSIAIHPSMNKFNIWGFSFVDVEKTKICLKFGIKNLACSSVELNLEEPKGNYIPLKEDDTGIASEVSEECSGWSWFTCFATSVTQFGLGFYHWLTNFWWTFIIAALCLVTIIFLPYIISFIVGLIKLCNCCRKRQKFRMPRREEIIALAKSVQDKKAELLKDKKKFDNDNDDLELLPLFQKGPSSV